MPGHALSGIPCTCHPPLWLSLAFSLSSLILLLLQWRPSDCPLPSICRDTLHRLPSQLIVSCCCRVTVNRGLRRMRHSVVSIPGLFRPSKKKRSKCKQSVNRSKSCLTHSSSSLLRIFLRPLPSPAIDSTINSAAIRTKSLKSAFSMLDCRSLTAQESHFDGPWMT